MRGLEISVWFWFVRRVSVELDTMIDKPLNVVKVGLARAHKPTKKI